MFRFACTGQLESEQKISSLTLSVQLGALGELMKCVDGLGQCCSQTADDRLEEAFSVTGNLCGSDAIRRHVVAERPSANLRRVCLEKVLSRAVSRVVYRCNVCCLMCIAFAAGDLPSSQLQQYVSLVICCCGGSFKAVQSACFGRYGGRGSSEWLTVVCLGNLSLLCMNHNVCVEDKQRPLKCTL